MNDQLRIHVIDDDEAMRASLEFLLGSAGLSTTLHASAESLLQEMPSSGCVLSDIRMPGIDGIELLRRLKAAGASIPVVLMTGHGDVALAVEAMKLGAADFVEKPFDDVTLLGAIRDALAGQPLPDPAQQDFLRRLATLSRRERQVFDRLVEGDANKAIARALGLSPRTVEIYRSHVMTKLGMSGVADLVRAAVRAGAA